eukprot:gene16820-18516_t
MASRNGPSSRGGYQKVPDDLMEQDNNRLASSLSGKVSTLKNIALDIESEAKYQNKYLDGMGEEMDISGSLLGGSFQRLTKMVASGSSNRKLMCYFVLITVGIFFFGYYILSRVKR